MVSGRRTEISTCNIKSVDVVVFVIFSRAAQNSIHARRDNAYYSSSTLYYILYIFVVHSRKKKKKSRRRTTDVRVRHTRRLQTTCECVACIKAFKLKLFREI